MLKIYCHKISFPSNKVTMCVNALGLEHEYCHVDLMSGEQKSEAYLKINAKGKVPAIDDNGFCLTESNAIMQYLAAKADKLYPQAHQAKAKVDEALSYVSHHVGASIAKVLFNQLFAPMMKIEVDERSMKEGREFLINQQLPALENILSQQSYIGGNDLSIADVALVATLDPVEMIDLDLSAYPKLMAYRNALRAQDWYLSCHQHFGEGFAG